MLLSIHMCILCPCISSYCSGERAHVSGRDDEALAGEARGGRVISGGARPEELPAAAERAERERRAVRLGGHRRRRAQQRLHEVSNRVGSIFGNVLCFENRRAVGPGGSFACCRGSRNSWSIAASPGLRETEKLQCPEYPL